MKVIKYGATWCNPCVLQGERLKESNITFSEVDVDEDSEAFAKKCVSEIPYLEFYDDNNNLLETHSGLMTIEELNQIKEKYD